MSASVILFARGVDMNEAQRHATKEEDVIIRPESARLRLTMMMAATLLQQQQSQNFHLILRSHLRSHL